MRTKNFEHNSTGYPQNENIGLIFPQMPIRKTTVQLLLLAFPLLVGCNGPNRQPSNPAPPANSNAQAQAPFGEWNQILLGDPDNTGILRQRALAYEAKGAYYSALDDYNRILKLDPSDRATLLRRAELRMKTGQDSASLADYESATRGLDDRSAYFNARGVLLIHRQEFQAAVLALDTALRMRPSLDQAWYNKGTALYELGDAKEAEFHFQKTLQINPQSSQAFSALGFLFLADRADTLGAIWYFEKATAADPANAQAWLGLGNVEFSENRIESALVYFGKAVAADSTYAEAWCNQGLALFRKMDYPASEKSYSAAIRHDPRLGRAFAMRGIIRCQTGKRLVGCEDLHAAQALKVAGMEAEIRRFCR